jgi:UDP-N-acetylmuramate dehydrogenase
MPQTRLDLPLEPLRAAFGTRLQENVPLAHYTTARVGGPADALLPVHTADELARAVSLIWENNLPYVILGGGSNILVSDSGFRGIVVLNRARNTRIDVRHAPPLAWAESGANLSALAHQAALRSMTGLEWAAAIPGSVGGAVYGNAGAFGSDMAATLLLAEILHPESGKSWWPVEQLEYRYRTSLLKQKPGQAVILSAQLKLQAGDPQAIKEKMEANSAQRRHTQPPGASMGSMFKNPPGDYAGRLIESAGLKGTRIGSVEISPIHANFFVNHGEATAQNVWDLILQARKTVEDKFGVRLELEIEPLGEYRNGTAAAVTVEMDDR